MVKSIFSKLLTLYIYILYPSIPSKQRWFIRFRYLGLFRQLRFFFKDHIVKKPYKIVSFEGEFQQELLHAIPFAYWHYLNGTLLGTRSSEFTESLYFFSNNHTADSSIVRSHKGNESLDIPNAPHDVKLLKYKWKRVPFDRFYKNNELKFCKPILIVANRYNTEWNKQPISYFDLTDLKFIFDLLQDKYQIIYNRPTANEISNDNSEILELGDRDWIKSTYKEVLFLSDLKHRFSRASDYNHLQLLVYANCSTFISIHGGTSTLASMFGGVNFIFSKEGHEHYLNEFENVFTELSGCKIKVYREKQKLFESLKQL